MFSSGESLGKDTAYSLSCVVDWKRHRDQEGVGPFDESKK